MWVLLVRWAVPLGVLQPRDLRVIGSPRCCLLLSEHYGRCVRVVVDNGVNIVVVVDVNICLLCTRGSAQPHSRHPAGCRGFPTKALCSEGHPRESGSGRLPLCPSLHHHSTPCIDPADRRHAHHSTPLYTTLHPAHRRHGHPVYTHRH